MTEFSSQESTPSTAMRVPMTRGQQALWAEQERRPHATAYSIARHGRIHGPLEASVMARAVDALVARHPLLTAVVALEDGVPMFAPHAVPVALEQLRGGAPGEAIARALAEPFSLERGPLVRFVLSESEAGDERWCGISVHHLIADGQSLATLARALSALVAELLGGGDVPTAATGDAWATLAAREAAYLASPGAERAAAYWKGELTGELPVLDLGDRAEGGEGGAGRISFVLEAELVARVRAMASAANASLPAALLAAFGAVLMRYDGGEELVIGCAASTRGRISDDSFSYQVNPLPIRLAAPAASTWLELVRRARTRLFSALTHRQYPYPLVVEQRRKVAQQGPRHAGPLFQALFAMQPQLPGVDDDLGALAAGAGGRLKLGTAEMELAPAPRLGAQGPLTLYAAETAERVYGVLEFDAAMVEEETAQQMVRLVRRALEAAAADPHAAVGQLTFEQEGEPAMAAAQVAAPLLTASFAAQVAARGEAIAVVAGAQRLSYAELDARANAVARRLGELGVTRESVVALCTERSAELLIGLLGILKAGGAYLPIDPSTPAERIGFLLCDAGARVLVVDPATRDKGAASIACAGAGAGAEQTVLLDAAELVRGADELARAPLPLVEGVGGSDLAYVIYTSGSTGQPKGVEIEHRQAARLFEAMRGEMQLSSDDVWALFHSASFDVSVWETWSALTSGARLVVVPHVTMRDGDELYELLIAERVTHLNQTPTAFRQLLGAVERRGADARLALRQIVLGGEAVDYSAVGRWRAVYGERVAMWNGYGPTETAIFATFKRMGAADVAKPGCRSIGWAVKDLTAHVVDAALREVPFGVVGELCIGGAGVARGYLGRAELTAARFVEQPGSARRIYRTGDRVRRRRNGELEYLGRADQQIKLRGYRIELGELEAALGGEPGVAAAAAAVREVGGEAQLVGYVVVDAGADVSGAGLRRALLRRLPEYMVPSYVVMLDALPTTASGKLDRRALPAPEGPRAHEARAYLAPRGAVEAAVAEVMEEVLGVPQVGRDDDFFALGGHSLLAARAAAALGARMQRVIPLRWFFESGKVAELAARLMVEAASDGVGSARAVALQAEGATQGPATATQRGLWLLEKLDPGSSRYHVAGGLELAGELSGVALAGAFEELVQRHEALRTRLVEVGDGGAAGLMQEIEADVRFEVPVVEVGELGEEAEASESATGDRRSRLEREIEHEVRRPFELSRGPLVRAKLLRQRADSHVLVVVLHHAIADGWSLRVLLAELAEGYRRRIATNATHRDGVAAPGRLQFLDVARWQAAEVANGAFTSDVQRWCDRLRELAPLALPWDRPRTARRSPDGGTVLRAWPLSLGAQLARTARTSGVTPFVLGLALYAAFLARVCRQARFAIGTPVANRGAGELHGVVGCLVNTAAIPVEVQAGAPLEALAAQLRRDVTAALAMEAVPFELVVETLRPEREPGMSPVFQTMFNTEHDEATPLQLGAAVARRLPFSTGTAKFDLSLLLRQEGEQWSAEWEYASDLFDAGTVERLAASFETFAAEALSRTDAPIGELSLLTDAERATRRLGDALPGQAPEPRVHRMFEAAAGRWPEVSAVEHAGRRLTYRELDAAADRLALALRARGVGRGAVVGVCLERSVELIVAFLGVLKTGAAYVPMDPSYPTARLELMIEDSGARVLLAPTARCAAWAHLPELAVVATDGCAEPAASLDEAGLADLAELRRDDGPPGDAYVIYTSGSTGRPKGTLISHRALATFLPVASALYRVGPGTRVLQFLSLSFDGSIEEIYPALVNGGTVILRTDELLELPALVAAYLDERIEMTTLPNTLWAELCARLADGSLTLPDNLRMFNVGGEKMLPEAALRWVRAVGLRTTLLNTYGPTEATVSCTACNVSLLDPQSLIGGEVPLGQSLANSSIYVLDEQLQELPDGVVGELYIGGDGLAEGYLHRAELTVERFLPDPFSTVPGQRMYRTGDLGRRRGDGVLEYLGRADHQIKLHGFRIELHEIEAALAQLPGVDNAVVLLRDDAPRPPRLVAYLLGAELPEEAELRRALRERLPDHMVPSRYVTMTEFPLAPGGKVDRRAFPMPLELEGGDALGALPRTAREAQLVAIWAEVLGRPVGVEDNFFALGGHSLLATQVIARIRAQLSLELPLRALFEAPTVAALALRVDALAPSSEPPLVRRDHGATPPLSFAQERLWFLDQLEPGSALYNVPMAVRLRGRIELVALERSLIFIEQRHDVLRATIGEERGAPVQRLNAPGAVAMEHVDLRALLDEEREAELALRLQREAAQPFELARGPLTRHTMFALRDDEHVWLLNAHHVVSDVWSTGVLIRELEACYRAFSAGERPELPALPVQYADYAVWQRERMTGAVLERELAFWRDQLSGFEGAAELPTDRPRAMRRSNAGATLEVAMRPAVVRAVEELAQRHDATPFMVLLAGLHALLGRLTGQDDLVIGTPIANRTRAETEPLLGFFVNTLALRADLSERPSFAELLAQVRERTLGAYAHQDLPFEQLVDALGVARDLSRNPLFDVMLAVQNAPMPTPALPGVSIEPLELDTATAKFDLTLTLEHAGGGIAGQLEYATELFDPETMRGLFERYQRLLLQVAAEPQRLLRSLPMLTEEETAAALAAGRAPARDWAQVLPGLTHQARFEALFAAQVARTPEAVAVSCEGERWTYAELAARAAELATAFTTAGVREGDVVAILAERSPHYVAAILAAFEAGAAYLPLDVGAPQERLRAICASCRPAVIAGDAPGCARAAELGIAAVELAAAPAGARPSPIAAAAPAAAAKSGSPRDAAYVLYTSGSTGVPKGALLEHAGMLNQQLAKVELLGLTARDVIAQTAAPTFDVSVWQFLTALLVGARTHIVRGDRAWDPAALCAELAAEGVTVLELVPSHLAVVIEHLELEHAAAQLAGLRWLMPTGEALPAELCRRWFAVVPQVPLVNAYGPTECSDDTALCIVDRPPLGDGAMPISGTVANLAAYVVDAHLELVPLGTPGELCIGGVGVGRGYVRDPARTAAAFVPDPWAGAGAGAVAEASTEGAVMYRSGDRARMLADGTVEFLGRSDHQIKLRGHRIELGEIEAALGSPRDVVAAAVVVRGSGTARRLVGFVVRRPDSTLDRAELLELLRARLPASLVPAELVLLEAMPSLTSGKIDRRALERWPLEETELRPFRAPATEEEQLVAAVWQEVLGLPRVGAEDDFFELGGHSLLATRVVAQLRQALALEVPVRLLFEHPTVVALALALSGARTSLALSPGAAPVLASIPRAEAADELLSRVEEMSEQELDALLAAADAGELGEP